ncbi:DUF7521 family protein [Halosimplex amylolyticum]|uniref:DUF7521 family protein n=1 Tax=Halosimplex amylolyticum TaxID=3396616 RepID=UPI003F54FB1E
MSGDPLALALALAFAETIPPLQTIVGVTPATLARSLTAVVGLFVAYQAFRGYRRNDSRPMLFLGLGIFLVTALPFVVTTVLAGPLGASDAAAVLAWTILEILGLGSILYALTGA